nr:neurofilament heavy polypeptide-like isoform X1 [Ipomoea batatas]
MLKVKQAPAKSMRDALVVDKFIRHPDVDVKVSVAFCFSEITRISAQMLHIPYDDEKMKYMMIRANHSIIGFLKLLQRDSHPDNVFSSMATIMSLIIEESEDVSVELLTQLLASVKKDSKDIMPIGKRAEDTQKGVCSEDVSHAVNTSPKSITSNGSRTRNGGTSVQIKSVKETEHHGPCNQPATAKDTHPSLRLMTPQGISKNSILLCILKVCRGIFIDYFISSERVPENILVFSFFYLLCMFVIFVCVLIFLFTVYFVLSFTF